VDVLGGAVDGLPLVYEAPSPDELMAAARRANLPAHVIVEVQQVAPEMVA